MPDFSFLDHRLYTGYPEMQQELGATVMGDRITQFHRYASILPVNKYFVGFWGEYVNYALTVMEHESHKNPGANPNPNINSQTKIIKGNKVYVKAFDNWINIHVASAFDQVDLLWTSSAVTIPVLKGRTRSDVSIDTIKGISYPLVDAHEATGTARITIVENRHMIMYQFFNAIMNRFFNARALRPRSSFHKMGMYIIVINGEYITPTPDSTGKTILKETIQDIPLQVFEFNSVVLKGMSNLNFSQNIPTSRLEFTIDVEAPNLFQHSFKDATLRGLRNNSGDSELILGNAAGVDSKMLDDKNDYNKTNLEVSRGDLKKPVNGYYRHPALSSKSIKGPT